MKLFDRIINPHLTVHRADISTNHTVDKERVQQEAEAEQLDLFVDYDALRQQEEKECTQPGKEKALQQVTLQVEREHGKNAVLKGMNLGEGANITRRNGATGGHKA